MGRPMKSHLPLLGNYLYEPCRLEKGSVMPPSPWQWVCVSDFGVLTGNLEEHCGPTFLQLQHEGANYCLLC